MKGIFIPDITVEMFRDACLESIETLMAEGEVYDIDYEPEQQWIPCSERLPDVARRVLLSGHGKVMVGMLHSFGKYTLEPTGISYIYPKGAIEAWMPLPESYKEDKDGK